MRTPSVLIRPPRQGIVAAPPRTNNPAQVIIRGSASLRHSDFGLLSSFVLRHSSFLQSPVSCVLSPGSFPERPAVLSPHRDQRRHSAQIGWPTAPCSQGHRSPAAPRSLTCESGCRTVRRAVCSNCRTVVLRNEPIKMANLRHSEFDSPRRLVPLQLQRRREPLA